MKTEVGYKKPLYMLPFDHRHAFIKPLFNKESLEELTKEEIVKVKEVKNLIYEGFKLSTMSGINKEDAAILVDEVFGDQIIGECKKHSFNFAICVEKSGKEEFEFEYGDDFGTHITNIDPTFVKVLIRYNPSSNFEINKNQRERLRVLSDFCIENNYKLLLEALIPPTEYDLTSVSNDVYKYDTQIRPTYTVDTIKELQDANIKTDIWKLEGMYEQEHYKMVVKQATSKDPDVAVIVLGRGDNSENVERWLTTGAKVKGVTGFAVGRTVFLDPILKFQVGEFNKAQAVEQIKNNFLYFHNIFKSAKNQ